MSGLLVSQKVVELIASFLSSKLAFQHFSTFKSLNFQHAPYEYPVDPHGVIFKLELPILNSNFLYQSLSVKVYQDRSLKC